MPPASAEEVPSEKSNRALEAEEEVILDRQLNGLQDGTGKRKLNLWGYTTRWDLLVIVISSIVVIAAGAANPLLVVSTPSDSSKEKRLTVETGHFRSTCWNFHRLRKWICLRSSSSLRH